jgi:5-keto 4-deoxyuronate isomerase
LVLLCSCSSNDVDDPTAAARAEFNGTCLQSEQSVVATAADACTRVEVGSTLANDDLACGNYLATETLDAEALCVGVTTVASGARAFFVCHVKCLPLNFWGN